MFVFHFCVCAYITFLTRKMDTHYGNYTYIMDAHYVSMEAHYITDKHYKNDTLVKVFVGKEMEHNTFFFTIL